ncbi:MAG: Do family serine endopeptidase [Reichenbachiella sp.]
MNKKQYFIGLVAASFLGGLIAVGGFQIFSEENTTKIIHAEDKAISFSNYDTKTIAPVGMNFVDAAKIVTPGVVHIRSTVERSSSNNQGQFDDYFRQFFGEPQGRQYQQRPSVGTGSGVILSHDGYIVTNNHVVENATDVEILLNDNRTFKAEVIGTDPTTDLALLKVDSRDLTFVELGNSDQVQVGEWVLAVGNPFEFRSTVTAGIISAKGRNINILQNRNGLAIESFLQTDAAVNPGNSGGALVNLKGQLVGINTAIATPTGTYAGYSFAVPATLVRKVVADLKEFGVVQRALLGINIRDVNSQLAEEEGLDILEGVYIANVREDSGADEAGLETGDVIIAINGQKVTKTAELQEKVALNRPGDKVLVSFVRDGKEKSVTATLKNTLNTTKAIVSTNNSVIIQGATFEDVSKEEAKDLNIEGGAKLVVLEKGKWKEAGIKEGFIITGIDKRPIRNVEDLSRSLSRYTDGSGILLEGIYDDGLKAFYGIGW